MPRRKCSHKQLAALKRGREIAHKRSKKTTNGYIMNKLKNIVNRAKPIVKWINAFNKAISPYNKPKLPMNTAPKV